ncbi:hypothetical protein GTV32_11280 [Gordonia sp. SID5947]|uniref:hypothetical protein n=1 Tax=Gordonia sp. SID5947 TaxID=2690315 RepID=UPI00137208E6|nr:hypothetical protein [Gordonia sp. SID5947]MYR06851.1 hypothetical protein [Gordonia sp. SID5947]
MTRSLVNGLSEAGHPETSSDDATDLELAEAEVAAAEAEAAAARARADAALARARVARLQRSDTTQTTGGSRTTEPVDAEPEATPGEAVATDPTMPAVTTSDTDTGTPDKDAVEVGAKGPGRLRRFATGIRRRLPSPRRPTKRGVAVSVMSVITVAALAVTAFIGWHHHQSVQEHTRAADFTAAADRGVLAITSLDYQNAKRDVQRILDQSTGAFYNDFKGRSDDFASVIEQSKVTTKGKITGSAVESVNGDNGIILVSASSEVTNAAGAKQEPRTWRLRVTMTDVDGTMKISKVDFVP